MKLDEAEYNKLLDNLKEKTQVLAKENINKNYDSIQLYFVAEADKEDKDRIVKTSLVVTGEFAEENQRVFLIASDKNDNFLIQTSLNLFDEKDYKQKATDLLIEMKSKEIYKNAKQELEKLKQSGIIELVDTNKDVKKRLEEVGIKKAFDIFLHQYLETKSQPKLTYTSHPLVEELGDAKIDEEMIMNTHNITKNELDFLKTAIKIGPDRAEELFDEFLELSIDSAEIKEPKSLEEIEKDNNLDSAEKVVLYLSNITATIYDLYNLKTDEEFSMDWFKEASETVIESFSDNQTSLFYVMKKIEEDKGITIDTLKIMQKGFPEPITTENNKQLYMNFETNENAEIKPFSP